MPRLSRWLMTRCLIPQSGPKLFSQRRTSLSLFSLEERTVLDGTLLQSQTANLAYGSSVGATVTASVTADAPGGVGRYRWHYHLTNVGYTSYAWGPDFGIATFAVPGGYLLAPSDFVTDLSCTVETSNEETWVTYATTTPTYGDGNGWISAGDDEREPSGLLPGDELDLWFTTPPVALVSAEAEAFSASSDDHILKASILSPGDPLTAAKPLTSTDCGGGGDGGTIAAPGTNATCPTSGKPVRYADGAESLTVTDLGSAGDGLPWGQSRSWTNAPGYAGGWVMSAMPRLTTAGPAGDTLVAALGANTAWWFDKAGAAYTERIPQGTSLSFDSGAGEFVLADGTGAVVRFYDFDPARPYFQRGGFKSYTDAAGNTVSATGHDAGGNVTEVQRAFGAGPSAVTESYLYAYGGSAVAYQTTSVTLRRKVGAGSWSTVRSVEYAYYDGAEAHGSLNDLKLVTIKDAAGAVLDQSYYRYYTGESGGYVRGLKYVLDGQAYARLKAAAGGTDALAQAYSDSALAGYADLYLEFDAQHRVTREVASGHGCSACSAGQGEYAYAYTAGSNTPGLNSWAVKTVVTLPDGTTDTVYTNSYGQVMLKAHSDGTSVWTDFYRFDANGRVTLHAAPSAVTGYSDTYADLVNYVSGNASYLSDSAGLYTVYSYYGSTTATSTTAGGADGYQDTLSVRHGETGTDIPQQHWTYFARTGPANTVYPVAAVTVYRNDNETGGQTTSYAYTWYTGATQAESVTTTLPTVTTGQNGSNSATSSTVVYDAKGRVTWTKDAAGFLSYIQYDDVTGAVVKTITDVNTANTGDFAGLPSGWSTPSGGGLHLISTFEVDNQGRTTKAVSPGGVTVYTVYNDAGHEVRSYTWDTANGVRVGPTTVVREDRAGGYTETLTMSATPTTSSGRPTGAESISGVLTLSRSYTNLAHQVVAADAYFDLTGVTYSTAANLGTLNTNYYRTEYSYGKLGQPNRTVSPAGTITRTEIDGRGRAVSVWVGTDDTPTTGFWSVTNLTGTNMVKVAEYEYDGGGVGDSNLTKVTQYPGLSAPARVTQTWYDWRDRAVATKSGVEASESAAVNRPITFTDFDNLGQATKVRVYDGDGVSITVTGGVPVAPSSGLLRAQTEYAYDELGRVYESKTYSVDAGTGTVSTSALTTDVWFDARGYAVKTAAPGGLVTKTAYDGAGRVTVSYATDGGGDTGYGDADDVSGDKVLTQTGYTYDGDGRTILTTTRDRFHDATDTGALGDPSSSSGTAKARVSYSAAYYDAAGRLTASVNVGTNGGTSYTRPGSAPARSDTVLVTGYEYDSAGRVWKVTDPRGIESRTEYDALGRTTKTVENYVDGVVSDADDKTTTYAYGPAGLTALTAWTSASAGQTTGYVYGVTTSASGVTSNDVRAVTRWPDPSTGSASSGQQDVVTVNALGQVVTRTDRNGTTHTYSYDVLGRVVADALTTQAVGVDAGVLRIEYSYTPLGDLFEVTSYDAASGGYVVNQVRRGYNGLGQLVAEWQGVDAAVGPSTPAVQYTYTEMAGGANHSRLTYIVYPSGYVLNYTYASGLDATVSRLSSLSDSGGTLESYDYLGLGTVVRRSHAQPGTTTGVITGGTGDAGDQYAGLDRFGRVTDLKTVKTSTSTTLAESLYGYDRGGNRVWKDDGVNAAFGELYSYDGLNQLTGFDRGTLNGTKTGLTGSASTTTDWDYDALGNFQGVDLNGTTTARTHNQQNEVTGVGSATLTYDANGNLTTDETGRQFVYDSWNRLVGVKDSSGNYLEYLRYDGFGRKVRTSLTGGASKDNYYSSQWQVLEERDDWVLTNRTVYSPVYVDAVVLRDHDTDGNGTLDQRLYVEQDANWNVTALVDVTGAVVERYAYSPYGERTIYNPTYAVLSASGFAFTVGWQGMSFDSVSGLWGSTRIRGTGYSPTLGRFVSNDPIYPLSGTNAYTMESNNPVNRLDPSGLWTIRGTLGSVANTVVGGVIGVASGAATGFVSGGVVGGVAGTFAGGVGALPGAAIGAVTGMVAGGASGGVAGSVSGFKADSVRDATMGGLVNGGAAGIPGGIVGAVAKDVVLGGISHLDVGGEGKYPGATNLNPQTVTSYPGPLGPALTPIPNRIPGKCESMPNVPNGSVQVLTLENVPIRPGAAEEIARVIRAGGEVRIVGPASGLGTNHDAIIRAVGGVAKSSVSGTGETAIRTTIIKAPPCK